MNKKHTSLFLGIMLICFGQNLFNINILNAKESIQTVYKKISKPQKIIAGLLSLSAVICCSVFAIRSNQNSKKLTNEKELSHCVKGLFQKDSTGVWNILTKGLSSLTKQELELKLSGIVKFLINSTKPSFKNEGKTFFAIVDVSSSKEYFLCLDDKKIYSNPENKYVVAKFENDISYFVKKIEELLVETNPEKNPTNPEKNPSSNNCPKERVSRLIKSSERIGCFLIILIQSFFIYEFNARKIYEWECRNSEHCRR